MVPVAGIILAAGQSTRMGEKNKLVMQWHGKALVRHVVDAARASELDMSVVVTGHQPDLIMSQLPEGAAVTQNDDYAGGMAGSLRTGCYRLRGLAAVMVLLGDMPLITTEDINRIILAYKNANSDEAIIVATCDGKWGNPVLFGPAYFTPIKMLEGDRGARDIVKASPEHVTEVEIGIAAQRDFDTPDAFSAN